MDAALKVAPVVILNAPHNFDFRAFEQKTKGHVVGITRIKYRKATMRRKRALYVLLEIRKSACREA